MKLRRKISIQFFFFKDSKEKLGVFLRRYNERKKTKNSGKKIKIFCSEKKNFTKITAKGIKKKIIKNSIFNFFFKVSTTFPQLKTYYHFLQLQIMHVCVLDLLKIATRFDL